MNRVVFSQMVLSFGAFLLAVAIDVVAMSAPLALHTMVLRGHFQLDRSEFEQLAAAFNQPIEDFHVDYTVDYSGLRMDPLK
jgi:hypothetical protein